MSRTSLLRFEQCQIRSAASFAFGSTPILAPSASAVERNGDFLCKVEARLVAGAIGLHYSELADSVSQSSTLRRGRCESASNFDPTPVRL